VAIDGQTGQRTEGSVYAHLLNDALLYSTRFLHGTYKVGWEGVREGGKEGGYPMCHECKSLLFKVSSTH